MSIASLEHDLYMHDKRAYIANLRHARAVANYDVREHKDNIERAVFVSMYNRSCMKYGAIPLDIGQVCANVVSAAFVYGDAQVGGEQQWQL